MPERALRFNSAIAVPEADAKLRTFLDESIGRLLAHGDIQQIVERYGVPFFQPFVNVFLFRIDTRYAKGTGKIF